MTEAKKAEVQELLERAEMADAREEPTGQQLPQEIGRREKLRAKMEEARRRLERRAKERAAAERAEYEAKVKAREARRGNKKGPKIKTPDDKPGPKEQENLTDTDSRLMRKNKRSGYDQKYSAQAVVDAEGSQLILAARVSQCASDRRAAGEGGTAVAGVK